MGVKTLMQPSDYNSGGGGGGEGGSGGPGTPGTEPTDVPSTTTSVAFGALPDAGATQSVLAAGYTDGNIGDLSGGDVPVPPEFQTVDPSTPWERVDRAQHQRAIERLARLRSEVRLLKALAKFKIPGDIPGTGGPIKVVPGRVRKVDKALRVWIQLRIIQDEAEIKEAEAEVQSWHSAEGAP